MRFALSLLAALATWTTGAAGVSVARADTKESCIASADRGQLLRDRGEFHAARAELLACASPACPAVVRTDCVQWVGDLRDRMPEVVIRATVAGGADVTDVRVFVDDRPVADSLDGRPLEVDPGLRTFRFERNGMTPVTIRLLAREGEKRRPLDVKLGAAAIPSDTTPRTAPAPRAPEADRRAILQLESPKPSRSVPFASVGLGVLGVAGIGAFTYLALDAERDVRNMRSGCAPACNSSDVDGARTQTLIANVSLGVGVVALAAAAWIWLSKPAAPPSLASAQR